MKSRIIILTAIFAMALITTKVKSQDLTFNGGADFVIPIGDFGDFASFGAGITLGGEYPIADQLSATLQLGYDFISVKSELSDVFASYAMMPVQLGVKYYFEEVGDGLYAHGQLGIHSLSFKTEEVRIFGIVISEGGRQSSSDLSFAFGGGTVLNEILDLGLRFNIISGDGGSLNYLGLRGAYMFGG